MTFFQLAKAKICCIDMRLRKAAMMSGFSFQQWNILAECHNAECCYAECSGAIFQLFISTLSD
jgi:hypothetical protein